MSPSDFLPDFDIRISGAALPSSIRELLTGIEVVQEPNTLDDLRITLGTSRDDPFAFPFNLVPEGSAVEVSLGYVDHLTKVFEGELTGVAVTFSADEPPSVELHGHSYMHRLRRGMRTKTYLKQKDSAIAAQLGRGAGLRVQATDSKVSHDFVLQYNQTDLEFLLERASRIGFELFADGKQLHFRSAGGDARAAIKLVAGETVVSLTLREELVGQGDSVTVRSVDKMGKAIVGKALAGQIAADAARSGPTLSKRAFGAAETFVVDRPLDTKADADALALSVMNGRAAGFVTGSGRCDGLPSLRAGGFIELHGLMEKFNGKYYVVRSTHVLDSDGYHTSFGIRRNAVG